MTLTDPEWGQIADIPVGSIAAAVTAVVAVVATIRKVWPIVRRAVHLVDDLAGRPARPGVSAQPGVMERLGKLETQLDEVRHEVTTNDGTSLKDATSRTEARLQRIAAQVEELTKRL